MTPTESRKVWDIERSIHRQHRRRHWTKVGVWVGLFLAGAVLLLAVGTLLASVVHLAVAR